MTYVLNILILSVYEDVDLKVHAINELQSECENGLEVCIYGPLPVAEVRLSVDRLTIPTHSLLYSNHVFAHQMSTSIQLLL